MITIHKLTSYEFFVKDCIVKYQTSNDYTYEDIYWIKEFGLEINNNFYANNAKELYHSIKFQELMETLETLIQFY